ncbi:MAG: hypothetical protein IK141_05105 [Clostridia bacterium]|nr:hypothetical protein [Clostridia bacterium]
MSGYYNSYKGSRRRKRNRIRIILLILLLLVLLVTAALFFLQDRAIFTSEGFRFPFRRDPAQEQAEDPDDLSDFQLEIEDGDPAAPVPGSDSSADDPATPVPVHEPPLAAWQVAGEALLDNPGEAVSAMQSAGRTQLAIVVKTADHQILVADAGASQGGVSPRAADFAARIESLEQAPVAILPALRDDLRPRSIHRASALKTTSGAVWLDRTYTAWYDPTGKDTAADLLAQINACQAAGFRQVILTDFCFPTVGKTELINFNHISSRTAALTALAKQLSEGTDCSLGLLLTKAAAQDLLDSAAGQDVMELAQYFDVLYLDTDDPACDPAVLESALEDTGCRVGIYAGAASQLPESGALDSILHGN